jgi:peptidoglycan hydrolase-like protein with peptidoglycan-binding domain
MKETKYLQIFLNANGFKLEVDGVYGNETKASGRAFFRRDNKPVEVHVNSGLASSFADPDDVDAFLSCKARGGSDQHCFGEGDNGKGRWGDDTTVDSPMCALPPEDWRHLDKPRGARVRVEANGHTVVAELRDTMPHKRNIHNGAIIDLNPAACKALGLNPPVMTHATWRWA